jgi:multidrug efflux pump subunit AcrB
MMWEYMWPIPKFAIMALLISLAIAFTINPWISFYWAKDVEEKDRDNEVIKESKYDVRKFYLEFMKSYLNKDEKSNKKRKLFKLVFWISYLLF